MRAKSPARPAHSVTEGERGAAGSGGAAGAVSPVETSWAQVARQRALERLQLLEQVMAVAIALARVLLEQLEDDALRQRGFASFLMLLSAWGGGAVRCISSNVSPEEACRLSANSAPLEHLRTLPKHSH